MDFPMRKTWIVLAACCGLFAVAQAEEAGPAKPAQDPALPSAVADILRRADPAGMKAVVLFRRKEPQGEPMAHGYEAAREKLSGQTLFLAVDADDPKEIAAARRYQIDRVEGPALLVLASDGTLLAGFVQAPDVARIERVLASKLLPDFQRAMALGALLLVAVGDPKTEPVQSMIAQAQAYADRTQGQETILQIDPADPAEAYLLDRLGVKKADGAVLCLLKAGRSVGKIPGKVSAGQIEKLVSGCGPGGCGPDG